MPNDLEIDFIKGPFGYRRRRLDRGEPLLRAIGLRGQKGLKVADATAGLGRDGFLMAAAGADVVLVERSPEVFQRLKDALEKAASAGEDLAAIAGRIQLICGDAREVLQGREVDAILVDPMHPERRNSALVKKEMRDLRLLVGSDPDRDDLIRSMLRLPAGRVVVKWPLHGPLPEDLPRPSFEIAAKTVRYSVFVGASNRPPARDPLTGSGAAGEG